MEKIEFTVAVVKKSLKTFANVNCRRSKYARAADVILIQCTRVLFCVGVFSSTQSLEMIERRGEAKYTKVSHSDAVNVGKDDNFSHSICASNLSM